MNAVVCFRIINGTSAMKDFNNNRLKEFVTNFYDLCKKKVNMY